MSRRLRFRPGYQPSPRQTAFRLSPAQRVALEDALSPHTLTPALRAAIEDRLHAYWNKTKQHRAAETRLAAWQVQLRRAELLVRELRGLLPLTGAQLNKGWVMMTVSSTNGREPGIAWRQPYGLRIPVQLAADLKRAATAEANTPSAVARRFATISRGVMEAA